MAICSICLEDNITGVTTPCEHRFHLHCLKQWFDTTHFTCPVCRQTLDDLFVRVVTWVWDLHIPEEFVGEQRRRRRRQRATPYDRRRSVSDTVELPMGVIPFGLMSCYQCGVSIERESLFLFACGHCFHIQCAWTIHTMALDGLRRLSVNVRFCETCTRPTEDDLNRMRYLLDREILA